MASRGRAGDGFRLAARPACRRARAWSPKPRAGLRRSRSAQAVAPSSAPKAGWTTSAAMGNTVRREFPPNKGGRRWRISTNPGPGDGRSAGAAADAADDRVIDAFRRWGYLEAALDPLGLVAPRPHPRAARRGERRRPARAAVVLRPDRRRVHAHPRPGAQALGAGAHGAADSARSTRDAVLERLVRADLFEEVLHGRYPGSKRFSLEGVTGAHPAPRRSARDGRCRAGSRRRCIGMSHRGRLNVMVQIVGRSALDVYAGFEDPDPKSVLGSGDVKYHMGATGTYRTQGGRDLRVKLVSNPSHLEAVYPVALGRTRARQIREGEGARRRIMPIVLHGDAAFAGPGHHGRNAQPRRPSRLHRRRHDPRRGEQPARVHDVRPRAALVAVLRPTSRTGCRSRSST